ncbi:zinc finger protein ZXDC [Hoplias malabaricus]|uniref:zinc finger protein ZXDC n=1 Tax=Hoplias malabaricus TaxID=27720 RepID=UPI00346332D6
MEIQGLTDAQNTHYQHGAPRKSVSSPLGTGTAAETVCSRVSKEGRPASHGLQSDSNNNRRRGSSAPQNGGIRPRLCLQRQRQEESGDWVLSPSPVLQQQSSVELCNLSGLKEKDYGDLELPADFVKAELKYGELQMAALFEGEDGYEQRQLMAEELEQQQDTNCNVNVSSQSPTTANGGKNCEEFYVVFNIVQEGSENALDKEQRTRSCNVKVNTKNQNVAEQSKSTTRYGQHSSVFSEKEADNIQSTNKAKQVHGLGNVNDRLVSGSESAGKRGLFEADIDLSDGGVNVTEKLPDVVTMSSSNFSSTEHTELGKRENKYNSTVESESVSNGSEVTGLGKSPEYVADYGRLAPDDNGDAHDAFSGTITINNQSILLTIENGVLTLAAPPEGYAYKEDSMLSLKEHLGMKEHEDIVLLNYDGGTKSIGKISNVPVNERSAVHSASDSELILSEDCPLPGLDSCRSVKQEEGALGAGEEASALGHGSKSPSAVPSGLSVGCEDEMQPVNLGGPASLAKKGALVTYHCPHSGCPEAFDSRQKLKMHLVFHTEDQRPFKCMVEGCGWSFTTSYKLKRHLQSHDKVRPYKCEWENCGRRFTTVYNLKAHVKAHDQEDAFVCEICNERFRSATRLSNHQRTHFEPERPHKCEFPGCEKAFITFSALFSHNRTHFRETGQFTCTYPGCDKRYDKACRLKIHLRSHTGERPFVCDFESCGWTFTSMSKLLRHKRKHDDDRRFTCPEEGCGKSFTRAEHLKGHSITHLGTKPFECRVEGCNAKFSARSSLYIHSKKHRQDGVCLRSRCPVAGCTKHFSSRSSLKSHMLKHHNLSPDVLNQLESTTTLTPSCELTSAAQTATTPGSVSTDLSSLDLSSLFSTVPSGSSAPPAGPSAPSGSASFTMDMSLVSAGILTIDPTSVGSSLTGGKTVDPLILAAGADMGTHVLDTGLGSGTGGVLQQTTLHLDDVQTVNPEALGALTALAIQNTSTAEQLQALSSSSALTVESPSSSLTQSLTPSLTTSLVPSLASATALAGPPVPELLSPQPKADIGASEAAVGHLLSGVDVLAQQENSKRMRHFVFPSHSTSYGGQKDTELPSVTTCSFMESSGSARTDYRAIQLAKRKKQKGPAGDAGSSGVTQRKLKGSKGSSASGALASGRFGEGAASTTTGLTLRDPVTGAQYVQIQLLQDDPATDGDLAFQLSSQTTSSHSQLTVDLPVNILQEPSVMPEDDNGSDNSQFTGSTINLQDLE